MTQGFHVSGSPGDFFFPLLNFFDSVSVSVEPLMSGRILEEKCDTFGGSLLLRCSFPSYFCSVVKINQLPVVEMDNKVYPVQYNMLKPVFLIIIPSFETRVGIS